VIDEELDLLVVGSGVAGLSAAVRAANQVGLRVGVLTKATLEQAATRWAQGGVAAVLGGDPDSTDLHLADTLGAGAGLCDRDAVRVLVDEGPMRVTELIAMGAMFDRDASGQLQLAREGGHSLPRIVHAGGAATGAEIERALVVAVQQTAAALYERWFALDLVVRNGRCAGV
jgi:L-aspartate oxidase